MGTPEPHGQEEQGARTPERGSGVPKPQSPRAKGIMVLETEDQGSRVPKPQS